MALLPHSNFSTEDLAEPYREDAWREDISVVFDYDRAPMEDPDPFHASLDVFHFGHSALARCKASHGRYVRSPIKIARDGMGSILIQLFIEGGVQFGVGQRTTYAEAGDIVVFDLAQPLDNINAKFHNITAVWPREAIEAIVPEIARWHGYSLPRDNPSVALLRQHMISSCAFAPRFSKAEGHRIENATLSLLGAAMAGNALLPEQVEIPAMKEILIYQIKRHIRTNLGSTDQSPEQIARHFGISRRHLYQLLESIGGVTRYQMYLRLRRCMADLQSPQNAHLQVSEIAYRWGFKNLATFNRNFRNSFGMTPSEARNDLQQPSSPRVLCSPLHNKKEDSLAEHQQWFMSLGI